MGLVPGLVLQHGRGRNRHPAGTGLPTVVREKQPVLEELRAVTTQEQECWICLSSRTTGPGLLHWLPLAFGPVELQQPDSSSFPSHYRSPRSLLVW